MKLEEKSSQPSINQYPQLAFTCLGIGLLAFVFIMIYMFLPEDVRLWVGPRFFIFLALACGAGIVFCIKKLKR